MTERIPPQDQKAEKLLLGKYLFDPGKIDQTPLSTKDFYSIPHRHIFDALLSLKHIADLGSVRLELRRQGQLETVGGEAYLAGIEHTSAENIRIFESKIKELSIRRQKIQENEDQLQELYDITSDYPVISNEGGIYRPDDIKQEIMDYYREGHQDGHSTGLSTLNEHIRVFPWLLYVVTGIPQMGKSEFIDWLLVNQMKLYNDKIAYFSPENYPLQRHASKILEKITYKPFMRGPTTRMSEAVLEAGIEELQEHVFFIYPDEKELDLDHILEKFKICKAKYGINGVVIDPFNELDYNCPAHMNQSDYIGECLTKMRRFARVHDVYFILVAHPRMLQKNDDGKYDPPTLYQISGSANFYNKADVGICVHRDVMDGGNEVDIHIQKVRFKWVGHPGTVPLKYERSNGTYYEEDVDKDEF